MGDCVDGGGGVDDGGPGPSRAGEWSLTTPLACPAWDLGSRLGGVGMPDLAAPSLALDEPTVALTHKAFTPPSGGK